MPGDAATPVLPDFTSQSATVYKTNIDAGFAVLDRLAWAFAPHEQDTPDMTVRLELGSVFDGTTLTEVAAQDTGTITAPSSDPRIDRVVIDRDTGVVSVITGAEDASPTAPSITAGKIPIAQVAFTTGTTEITNTDITDERDLRLLGIHGIAGDGLEADDDQNLRINAPHDRKTDDYTALAADRGKLIEMDKATAITLDLTAAATLGEGWFIYVNNSGVGTLTIDPDSSETIDDVTTIVLGQNQSTMIFCDGTSFWTVGRVVGGGILATEQAGSGTEIDFTDIPSWVKKIRFMFDGLETNGTSIVMIQLGDSEGFETTGYVSIAGIIDANPGYTNATVGFILAESWAGTWKIFGIVEFNLQDLANNTWVASHNLVRDDVNLRIAGGGRKSLSGVLTQIRLTTINGTDAFDAGAVNIMYE